MSYTEVITFLATMFSMMNPIGNLGIFAGMTADKTTAEARGIAIKCAIAAAITLIVVLWVGSDILDIFGIDVTEIRVAGGLIVLLIGLNMMFDKSEHNSVKDEKEKTDDQSKSIAVVPLAIPLLAGPGTMAAVLVTAHHHTGIEPKLIFSLAAIAICVFIAVLFSFAKPIANKIGENGMSVVSRIMGLVLIAIAIGMLNEGLIQLFPILGTKT